MTRRGRTGQLANQQRSVPRAALALLCVLALLAGRVRPAAAQIDPVILGHAVDATVQLSIVVRGTVDMQST